MMSVNDIAVSRCKLNCTGKHVITCKLASCILLLLAVCCTGRQPAREPVEYVNPLVGTLSSYNLSTGNTYPAIAVPWGMHAWTPQTGADGDGWTYRYDATHIRGFKQTHQPSPWINDYEKQVLSARG